MTEEQGPKRVRKTIEIVVKQEIEMPPRSEGYGPIWATQEEWSLAIPFDTRPDSCGASVEGFLRGAGLVLPSFTEDPQQ